MFYWRYRTNNFYISFKRRMDRVTRNNEGFFLNGDQDKKFLRNYLIEYCDYKNFFNASHGRFAMLVFL